MRDSRGPVIRHDTTVTLPWMREGTAFLLGVLDRVPDEALREPSALPGWSRAHVVGHLARNAEALSRLVAWARTGVETPMYADLEQRAADIDASAGQLPDVLRRDLARTAAGLDRDLEQLDASAWTATVRTRSQQEIPATAIPWLRVREVWLHAVDLAAGASTADLPPALVDTLVTDVAEALWGAHGCPAARLDPADREDGRWRLGPETGDAIVVSGLAAEILAWLVGRDDGSGLSAVDSAGGAVAVPVPPRWL